MTVAQSDFKKGDEMRIELEAAKASHSKGSIDERLCMLEEPDAQTLGRARSMTELDR